mgnify:CR=1 FL=1
MFRKVHGLLTRENGNLGEKSEDRDIFGRKFRFWPEFMMKIIINVPYVPKKSSKKKSQKLSQKKSKKNQKIQKLKNTKQFETIRKNSKKYQNIQKKYWLILST